VDEIGRLKAKLTEVEGLIDDGEQENKTLKEKLGEAEDFIRHQDEELKRLREQLP
jgi:chromosome segregation ATPase